VATDKFPLPGFFLPTPNGGARGVIDGRPRREMCTNLEVNGIDQITQREKVESQDDVALQLTSRCREAALRGREVVEKGVLRGGTVVRREGKKEDRTGLGGGGRGRGRGERERDPTREGEEWNDVDCSPWMERMR
jgi:hypothetical protein